MTWDELEKRMTATAARYGMTFEYVPGGNAVIEHYGVQSPTRSAVLAYREGDGWRVSNTSALLDARDPVRILRMFMEIRLRRVS